MKYITNNHWIRRLMSQYKGTFSLNVDEKIENNFDFFIAFLVGTDKWMKGRNTKLSEVNLYLKRHWKLDKNVCTCRIIQHIPGGPRFIKVSTNHKEFVTAIQNTEKRTRFPSNWTLQKIEEVNNKTVITFKEKELHSFI